MSKLIKVNCPKCHKNTLEVEVEEEHKSKNDKMGEVYHFSGHSHCTNCNYKGYHSESLV